MSAQLPDEPTPGEVRPARPTRDRLRLGLAALIGALLAALALLNLDSVKVDWIVGSTHSPLIIVILVSFLLGALFGPALRRRGRHRPR